MTGACMTVKEQFLSKRERYQPIALPQEFSDEEMARDWTLSEADREEIDKHRKSSRLLMAIQLCAVRLYGRFLNGLHDLSPRIVNYLNRQLDLSPVLTIQVPEREATYLEQRKTILNYLGFQKFDEVVQEQLQSWLEERVKQGVLPDALFEQAESHLLASRTLLPGPSVLERLIIHVCAEAHTQLFESIYQRLSPDLCRTIDQLLAGVDEEQRSPFAQLKEYPPAAKISSLLTYLRRYQTVAETGIDTFEIQVVEPAFQEYLFKLAKKYSAKELKRFKEPKRYALMICFLLETRKMLLDHLVKMHDQYVTEMCRQAKNAYEQKHRALRKRQKKAVDTVLATTSLLLDWPDEKPLSKQAFWQQVNEGELRTSLDNLRLFQRLEERGYGDLLLARYSSMRKYFAQFIRLPFAAERGSDPLLRAIQLVRHLDAEAVKQLPRDAPTAFVPQELRRALKDTTGNIQRNAWEMGLALAIKDAFGCPLGAGDLYLPQSKQYISFWGFLLSDPRWQAIKDGSFAELQQPQPHEIKVSLTTQFHEAVTTAKKQFGLDHFAEIQHDQLKLKREEKVALPDAVTRLQKVIEASLPAIRIEQLLMEVDQLTQFSQYFTPIQGHQARPKQFYKTLLAALISQATNLGVVAMSASVQDMTVDMLRHVLHFFVREETLTAANAEIVNRHHQLPLSAIHGTGILSSSDAQRFGIRASSLLATYYPRYYGYYEKAIGIYTHVSDQYSVFSTKVISCSPREALYVLDGLLENNTILQIREHTTDTHGYTEIIFALCYLLGYSFMPRIRDLEDQQLYRIDKSFDYGVFTPLLNKTVDLSIVEEQWEAMLRVALSLKQRTAPAHVIVQRLTNSFPSDRLAKAFTNLGRIIKTQYILRYLTDPELRRVVQRQLNKGEYRHKLPRWIFFANQGEFTTGNYEEIMNKASCLSLVSNAILYWNTIKINAIVENLRQQGEAIADETLAHISLLPFRHVLPNGTYFIDDLDGDLAQKPTLLR
jgi:TnpA family transposase